MLALESQVHNLWWLGWLSRAEGIEVPALEFGVVSPNAELSLHSNSEGLEAAGLGVFTCSGFLVSMVFVRSVLGMEAGKLLGGQEAKLGLKPATRQEVILSDRVGRGG